MGMVSPGVTTVGPDQLHAQPQPTAALAAQRRVFMGCTVCAGSKRQKIIKYYIRNLCRRWDLLIKIRHIITIIKIVQPHMVDLHFLSEVKDDHQILCCRAKTHSAKKRTAVPNTLLQILLFPHSCT